MLPILFYSYNDGFKSQQWDEWLFIAVFFVLFYFLGKNLTFQQMKVLSDSEKCQFYQNMREPSVKIETNLKSWQSLKVLNIAEEMANTLLNLEHDVLKLNEEIYNHT